MLVPLASGTCLRVSIAMMQVCPPLSKKPRMICTARIEQGSHKFATCAFTKALRDATPDLEHIVEEVFASLDVLRFTRNVGRKSIISTS